MIPKVPTLKLLQSQYADEIAVGEKQSRLGKVVTTLMLAQYAKIPDSDLAKLKAEDANFIDRYMKDPKFGFLIARYPWAPLAVDAQHNQPKQPIKESPMSNQDARAPFDVIYNRIGAASGSIIYADGSIDFAATRAALQDARLGGGMCAVVPEVLTAVKQIAAAVVAGKTYDIPGIELIGLTHIGNVPSKDLFKGGLLYSLRMEGETPGNSVVRYVYFVAGIVGARGHTKHVVALDEPGYKIPLDSPYKNTFKTTPADKPAPAPRKPATARLGDSVPPKVREQVVKREWPAFEEPELDTGRPRKKDAGVGKKKKSGGSRTERRLN